MNSGLADGLLATVMQWEQADLAAERPALQAIASYKYDEYQQFAPGMRFIESLAVWMSQFTDPEQRRVAYEFVKKRLTFFSNAEIRHLIQVAYPDYIRPRLVRQAAEVLNVQEWRVARITSSPEFQTLRRSCLYIGLSDGSRIDLFRRANQELSHEQIVLSYDGLSGATRVTALLEELRQELSILRGSDHADAKFTNVVLIDDFSGSGLSYIRPRKGGSYTGKIVKLCEALFDPDGHASRLIDPDNVRVTLVLYIATSRARQYLSDELAALLADRDVVTEVIVIQEIRDEMVVKRGRVPKLDALLDEYYSTDFEDRHLLIGGQGIKYGFGGCGLPLVLSHNTPNNSLYFLWVEGAQFHGLFPRRSRHGGAG